MEQLTIFDIPAIYAFDRFREYCRHQNAVMRFDDDDEAVMACSFKDGKMATCWADWQRCKRDNCPFYKEDI